MNIKQRIWTIPVMAVVVFIAGISVTYNVSSKTYAELNDIKSLHYPFVQKIEQLQANLKGIQENLKNAVSMNDQNSLKLAGDKAEDFRKTVESIKHIGNKEKVAQDLLAQFDGYYTPAVESAAIMTGAKTGDPSASIQRMISALQQLEKTLQGCSAQAGSAFNASLDNCQASVSRSMTINFISAAVIVTLLVLVSFLVIRSISVSLAKILCHTSSSEVIDLTRKIDITSNDEFGQIASWMNDFVENLNGIISNVSGAAKKVQEVSSDAAATNKTVSAGTAEQMNEAMTMAAAIEELSSSITDVARNSSAVAESASSTYSLAKNSGVVINRTMEEMHQVAQFVDEAVTIISKLGESSQEIDEITSVINDIADQTNLLALNAAIEAARAGEQGRGFAVVADEVRALAERTSQATRKITAMVQIIQGDTGKIISCIQSGKKQVTQGVEMANEAQKELEKILISIDDVTVKTQQIATAAEEQSSTSNEISANIERIVAISRDTSRITADATTRTAELGITVADLSRVVCKFKTA